jgi:dipeptide/tripeptide permease
VRRRKTTAADMERLVDGLLTAARMIDPFLDDARLAGYFVACGIGTIILGGLFLTVVPRIKRLMEGVS